ncbi:MAG: glycoside hydrolase family 127 protein [bacterium]|nr:glycoside hydrolase family 127 protein [bacterium]
MGEKLESIPLRKIQIQDEFWNKYIKLVKESIIPYQWKILNDLVKDVEPSHCIHNFKIAAGELEGEFEGAVFQDTDVAKWLEAVAYSLECNPDPELERLADETIELIGRAQQKDGYLNTYFTIKEPEGRFKNLEEGHELYTAGHMIEAAVAYYNATGKDKFLSIVSRFADLICETFGTEEGKRHGYPGHQEIELALVKLFRVTKRKKYLTLAKYFIDQRGVGSNYFLEEEKQREGHIFPEFKGYDPKYSQSHLPVREQETAEGHAVRAMYMYCAMADLSYEYQDKELLTACKKLWNNVVNKRMYITGGIGSSGMLERFTTDYDLPNDCNYSETCASIGMALFGKRMAEITKDASYMDIVEKELYNNVLSGISLDGTSFFYVNPLEVNPDKCISRTYREHVKFQRQKWFGVACCPPNIARTLASLGQYLYFAGDDALYVNLYIGNKMSETIAGNEWNVELDTKLPIEGKSRLHIATEKEADLTIALRIPSYARHFKVEKDGETVKDYIEKDGYAYLTGRFKETEITITFEQPAVFVRANPKVSENIGKVAIIRGPMVYCIEELDNGRNLPSIYVDSAQKLKEQYEENLLGGVVTLTFQGEKLKENWKEEELYSERKVLREAVSLKAVPYHVWANRQPGEMLVWIKEFL